MKTSLQKILLFVTFLIAFCFKASSQSQESVTLYKNNKFDKTCSKSIDVFKKKNKKLKLKLKENLIVDAEEIFLSTPEVFTQGKGGRKRVKNLKAPKHYRLANRNSSGIITITESGIIGSIDEYDITNEGLVLQSNQEQVLETDAPVDYNSPETAQNYAAISSIAGNLIFPSNNTPLSQTVRKVYVIDFDLFKALGSVQNAVNWAQAVHAGVSPYYSALGINTTLFKVIVNTDTTATYRLCRGANGTITCTSSQVLFKFATDYQNEPGDLIHLLTFVNYGGVAYIGGIGPTSNTKFCLSGVNSTTISTGYSWTINLVAHEEGHNFGSRHTQWCGWYKPSNQTVGRLDSCWAGEGLAYTTGCTSNTKSSNGQGTIMSYCQNNGGINLTKGFFFPQIREVMRRTVINSNVAGGPTNNCTWTYGPWSQCIGNNLGEVYPDGDGYQTRTATANTDICKGYPPELTIRACWVTPGSPTQPTANFAATYSTGVEAESEYKVYQNLIGATSVTFKDKSTCIPSTWAWDFGNGTTSTQKNPTALYSNAGVYPIKLDVSNLPGSSTLTKNDYVWIVSNNGIPTPNFMPAKTSGSAPLSVLFSNTSSNNSFQFVWNFRNSNGILVGTSQERNPRFTFSSAGTYTVSLTAINKNGQNTIEKVNLITVSGIVAPSVNFTASPLTGTAPLTVNFTDQSTNNPTSWFWNFGNGATSTERYPTYIYTQPGTYTVTLSAANAAGNNAFTRTNYITVTSSTVLAPVASFVGTPLNGSTPLIVQFSDLSINNPTSWLWNFGNGQTSTVKNPSTTYSTAGNYTVSLTATNSAGSNQQIRTNYVTVNTPGGTPTVTVFKKTDGLWWIRFTTSSTQSITTEVCRYGLSPCNPSVVPQCGGRTSPTTIINGNNEYLMSPQPTPPSSGLWCYRVKITQGGQVYWSNFFEFLK